MLHTDKWDAHKKTLMTASVTWKCSNTDVKHIPEVSVESTASVSKTLGHALCETSKQGTRLVMFKCSKKEHSSFNQIQVLTRVRENNIECFWSYNTMYKEVYKKGKGDWKIYREDFKAEFKDFFLWFTTEPRFSVFFYLNYHICRIEAKIKSTHHA